MLFYISSKAQEVLMQESLLHIDFKPQIWCLD